MSEKIEPALTVEEWAGKPFDPEYPESIAAPSIVDDYGEGVSLMDGMLHLHYDHYHVGYTKRPEAVIAVANAALPDSDPRKITRAMVEIIRQAGKHIGSHPHLGFAENLAGFADALASYLPPERP